MIATRSPLAVALATPNDVAAWRILAAEVEPLFGPLVGDPSFEGALARCIARGDAFCVREEPAEGAPLLGGLLFSRKPPVYRLGWLAVAARARRRGVGRLLVCHALDLVHPPAVVLVETFGPDVPDGAPARGFYASLGFEPAEMAPPAPDGATRQFFRLNLASSLSTFDFFDVYACLKRLPIVSIVVHHGAAPLGLRDDVLVTMQRQARPLRWVYDHALALTGLAIPDVEQILQSFGA